MSGQGPLHLWRIVWLLPEAEKDAWIQAHEDSSHVFLFKLLETGPEKGLWEVELLLSGLTDQAQVEAYLSRELDGLPLSAPPILIEPLLEKDWLSENVKSFPPLSVGAFYIYGDHVKTPPPSSLIPLCLNAATAFGSGEHPTTEGCLRALTHLAPAFQPQRILDMGCGSGILGIAAAKLFKAPVIAIDNDPEAVRVAEENSLKNGVDDDFSAACGEGYDAPMVAEMAPYDLVLANILATPLIEMAPQVVPFLRPKSYIILSGFLDEDAPAVQLAHEAVGLRLHDTISFKGWSTLVLTT